MKNNSSSSGGADKQSAIMATITSTLNRVDWLPGVQRPEKPHPYNSEIATHIEKLESEAVAGDETAIAELVLIHAQTSISLNRVNRGNPKAMEPAIKISPVWFGWASPFASLVAGFANLPVGASLLFAKCRPDLTDLPTACVFKLISYMLFLRLDLITDPVALKWQRASKELPLLTDATVEEWWSLAKQIIPEMFPRLRERFENDYAESDGSATNRLRRPFLRTWHLFYALLKVDANHC